MTKFYFKNPPSGWHYPFGKRAIKQLINSLDAEIVYVVFESTRNDPFKRKLSRQDHWVGNILAKRDHNGWRFALEVSAIRSEYITPWQDQIIESLFSEIRNWITKKIQTVPTLPDRPNTLYLKYEIKNNRVVSACFESDLDYIREKL